MNEVKATLLQVDDIRAAKLCGDDTVMAVVPAPVPDVERDDDGHVTLPGFLLSAHKPK